MKLVRYEVNTQASFGAVVEGGVVDLKSRLGLADIDALIASPELRAKASEIVATATPDHALADVTLLRPVDRPGKCICVGVNYPDRNAEYKDGSDGPKYPSLFIRFPQSLVPHAATIKRPPESEQLDYEGEIVMVIGKAGRRIKQADALDHVMGYTIANEGSIRDYMRHGKFNVTPGKNFDASGALGPWIVTADEIGPEPMRVTTRVNGEERQNDTTDRMLFPMPYLIEYISSVCMLEPGDIILTGTPSGAGARFDPPRYLKHGDVVEVEVTSIGTLSNTVEDEEV